MTGLRIFLTDGSYYDAIVEKDWGVIMHELVINGSFATNDFFCNRASVLKVVRLDAAQMQAGAVPPPAQAPASVIRPPQFTVHVGGAENSLAPDGYVAGPDGVAVPAPSTEAVEARARELYEADLGIARAWSLKFDALHPQTKDYWRDRATKDLLDQAKGS